MPLFDKQERHCLRISTQVVKWPERGDVQGVTHTVAWMEYVLWSRDSPRPVLQSVKNGLVWTEHKGTAQNIYWFLSILSSRISSESGLHAGRHKDSWTAPIMTPNYMIRF